jgi:Helicase HerA, central domain
MASNSTSSNDEPKLVSYDYSMSKARPLPSWAIRVGEVTYHLGTPNFGQLTVKLLPDADVRPGELLGVWHGEREMDSVTVIQVGDCQEVNPNETAVLQTARDALGLAGNYGREGNSTQIFRIAACDTVEEYDLRLTSGGQLEITDARSPQMLARSGDQVIKVPSEIQFAALGTLADPDKGLEVGTLYDSSNLPIVIKPLALQLHILLTGNPGRGKTYGSGVIMEEARAWGVPILAIDVHGELVPFAEDLGGLIIKLPDPKQFGLSLDLLTSQELLHITPNVDPETQYAELIELAHEQLKAEIRNGGITFAQLKMRIEVIGASLETRPASIKTATKRIGELANPA